VLTVPPFPRRSPAFPRERRSGTCVPPFPRSPIYGNGERGTPHLGRHPFPIADRGPSTLHLLHEPSTRRKVRMTTLAMRSAGQLHAPGRHESRALTDCCPDLDCLAYTEPTVVLDRPDADSRLAAYRCGCGERWLCSWWSASPHETSRLVTTDGRGTCTHCPASRQGCRARQAFAHQRCCRCCSHSRWPGPGGGEPAPAPTEMQPAA